MNKPYTKTELYEFLSESNFIEGVYDNDSYEQALKAWEYLVKQIQITPDIVCHTHKLLMINQALLPGDKGHWRKVMVYVGGRAGVKNALVPEEIEKWCEDMNVDVDTMREGDKEILAKKDHVQYEKIHPFIDGNGRTGRMFMNWWRLKNGLPLLIIKESERHKYYKWFK